VVDPRHLECFSWIEPIRAKGTVGAAAFGPLLLALCERPTPPSLTFSFHHVGYCPLFVNYNTTYSRGDRDNMQKLINAPP
jgi:hypothetical protein